jgi:hypothetical protein
MEGGRRSSRFCVGERDISEERGKRWREGGPGLARGRAAPEGVAPSVQLGFSFGLYSHH